MSDEQHHDDEPFLGPEPPRTPRRAGGARRATPARQRHGCVPVLIACVVALVLLGTAGVFGYQKLRNVFSGAPDYSGDGVGSVVVQVRTGDTATAIGNTLFEDGVVKSVGAFTDAARNNPASRNIQVGYYTLHKQMKASLALQVLVNPKNLVQSLVTVPEGARVAQVIDIVTKKTKITKAQMVAALSQPGRLGLPSAAGGDVEGWLFPATYSVVPGETATQLLRAMVAKAGQEVASLGVQAGGQQLGLSTEQVLTVASILEYEAKRNQDYPKVARAIYNRLKIGMKLQSDATVSYANNVSGEIWTSAAQRANSSPYNTYQHAGLPPGPIGSPGATTIEAALHPVAGSWLYWVVVNLRTGETVFSDTYAEHQKAVAQFQQYCQTSTAC